MAIRIVSFLALICGALALVPYGAHVAALPNKIGMTEARYFIAQSIYNGWAWFGVVLFAALLIDIVFAFFATRATRAFRSRGRCEPGRRRRTRCVLHLDTTRQRDHAELDCRAGTLGGAA
jgi:hypothetical protein